MPVVKKAFTSLPGYKVLQAFEMRKDVAAEAIEGGGWCNSEGKGRGGARRVYKDLVLALISRIFSRIFTPFSVNEIFAKFCPFFGGLAKFRRNFLNFAKWGRNFVKIS